MDPKKIRELEKAIAHHKALYYQGRPEISDEDYDKLEDDLKRLDPHNSFLAMVGSSLGENTQKVVHQKKMLSLDKTYEVGVVQEFRKKGDLVSVFKIDGSSCSLIYENGRLVMAKTRGDGVQGENITMKAAYINDIPKTLPEPLSIEVRGEIFCRTASLRAISGEMERLGLEKPTAQRNIVAGLLGRKEHITLARHLSFQAFDILGNQAGREEDKLVVLNRLGFAVPEWEVHRDDKSIIDRIETAKSFMLEGDYLIDGLVFVLNDLNLHEELGETSHHPRYKLAFKFQGVTKVAQIKDITWQVSRNGILTPVAEIAPTELSGAMINRVTLHNLGVVESFSLKPGDDIEVVRSGEVIPKFLAVAKSVRGQPAIPDHCPSCQSVLKREDIRLLCLNELCPAKRVEKILHWIRQVNIEDLSEKRLQEMIAKGLVVDIPDLYRLTTSMLLSLDKVKEKLATKIFENIKKTHHLDLVVFLAALGVDGVSTTKAEKIVAYGHNTIDKILRLEIAQLIQVDGFAEKSAADFIQSIQSKRELIGQLQEVGIKILAPEVIAGGVLEGKKFCVTGALSVPREEIEKLIKLHGGVVANSVSKNTTYLLTNDTDPTSSKYKKAIELGTQIINEEAFRQIIGV